MPLSRSDSVYISAAISLAFNELDQLSLVDGLFVTISWSGSCEKYPFMCEDKLSRSYLPAVFLNLPLFSLMRAFEVCVYPERAIS